MACIKRENYPDMSEAYPEVGDCIHWGGVARSVDQNYDDDHGEYVEEVAGATVHVDLYLIIAVALALCLLSMVNIVLFVRECRKRKQGMIVVEQHEHDEEEKPIKP
eukprot:CAMPEP_0197026202 /NCGR_PEP_ID=MMETSP1384-20130603/6354_1 /TAXON_ID=29189 /ORGANISM="Ammonia sp." /LENGTH=105 /DNA_ID=CAMNT_0042454831 /DNA_START=288 /DNA_END=605 /DNA_ORIENTATION=-